MDRSKKAFRSHDDGFERERMCETGRTNDDDVWWKDEEFLVAKTVVVNAGRFVVWHSVARETVGGAGGGTRLFSSKS